MIPRSAPSKPFVCQRQRRVRRLEPDLRQALARQAEHDHETTSFGHLQVTGLIPLRSPDGLGCSPPRLTASRLHKKPHQSLKIGSVVCKPSRSPRPAAVAPAGLPVGRQCGGGRGRHEHDVTRIELRGPSDTTKAVQVTDERPSLRKSRADRSAPARSSPVAASIEPTVARAITTAAHVCRVACSRRRALRLRFCARRRRSWIASRERSTAHQWPACARSGAVVSR
jgi:hypothetical protein